MSRREPTRTEAAILLAAIALAGLALRLVGTGFGLPAIYNPDEVAIMTRAMSFGTGDLNPGNFLYPSLYFYVLFAWEGLAFVVFRLAGVYDSVAEFERAFFADPTLIYLAGRALTALCGAATIVATYRLGSRCFGRTTGLAAGALLAVSPIAVRDGHYVKHDVPVTLLIVVVMVALASALGSRASRRPGAWIAAGVAAGLATSTHYYAGLLVVPLMLAAWEGDPAGTFAGRARILTWMGLSAAVAFVAASPFILAEPATAIRDVVANRQIVVDRAVGPGGLFGSLGAYGRLLVEDGLTWPVAVAATAGAALLLFDRRAAILVLAFPSAFLLFISNTVPASRYLNPALPFLALAAAVAIERASAAVAAVPMRRWVTAGLVAACAAPGLSASVHTGRFFGEADTRTLALAYVEGSIPGGASVLVQPYSVPLRPSRDGLVEALRENLGAPERASIKFQKMLALDPYPSPAYRLIHLGTGGLDPEKIYIAPAALSGPDAVSVLRARGVEYVVLKRYNDDSSLDVLRAALERDGQRLQEFSPVRGEDGAGAARVEPFLHNTDARIDRRLQRPGPALEIWRLPR